MATAPDDLLTSLLRDVSRSFHLTLRVLPGAIRAPIGLAYLLARATDTIADTELISVGRRLEALHGLRERILGNSTGDPDLGDLARSQADSPNARRAGSSAERTLLERIGEAVRILDACAPEDRSRIREVLSIIAGGQELDLRRFGAAGVQDLVALERKADLDDYTYRVAGCVGEFWTLMCRAHLFPMVPLHDGQLIENGVRFGKGLQLVNILRDLPSDLRMGRCYIPLDLLTPAGLRPADLLHLERMEEFRPIYGNLLSEAEAHLAAGWSYTNTLPRRCVRVRLACAWPVLIGVRTLRRLREGNPLDPATRIKITRREVKRVVWNTVWRYPNARAWERLFATHNT